MTHFMRSDMQRGICRSQRPEFQGKKNSEDALRKCNHLPLRAIFAS